MQIKSFLFSALIFIFFLSACTPPPPAPVIEKAGQSAVLQPVLEATNTPQTESAEVEVAAVEEGAADPEQPAVQPNPEDYPIVAPIVAVTDGYPEPEVIVPVDGSGYPEPDQESAESVTESLPLSQEVVISAPDELGLIGTFNSNQPDTPQPGVLLLHMAGGSRSDWETAGFVQLLNDQGYTTLALDLRGHGDSVSAVDWALAEEDMAVVWDWFVNQPEVDGANSMIVGASIGSSLALRSAVSQPAAKAAVLLSPGLNYFDVTTDDAIAQIDRPVLMVAMTLDKYSADTVTRLSEINPAVSTAEIQTGSSHGTSMFAMYDGLDLLILDFLNANRG